MGEQPFDNAPGSIRRPAPHTASDNAVGPGRRPVQYQEPVIEAAAAAQATCLARNVTEAAEPAAQQQMVQQEEAERYVLSAELKKYQEDMLRLADRCATAEAAVARL